MRERLLERDAAQSSSKTPSLDTKQESSVIVVSCLSQVQSPKSASRRRSLVQVWAGVRVSELLFRTCAATTTESKIVLPIRAAAVPTCYV